MSNGVIATKQVQSILEFDKIVASTEALCLTPMGKEALRKRLPTAEFDRIDRLREEVSEMLTVLRSGDGFPIVRVPDIRPYIESAGLEGSFLDPAQFLQIGEFLSAIEELLRFSRVSEAVFPRLEAYLEGLSAVFHLRTAVDRAISPEADVRDNASPELNRIRKERRGARDAVVSRLERMLEKRQTDPSRMDDLITLRNDRFVIPMREGDPGANDGVIQDRSGSGATLYVEPMKVVELNNRLRRLSMEETREVERILRGLTDIVRDSRFALTDDASIYGDLDAIHATAQFGLNSDGNVVGRLDRADLDLIEAHHPLLVLQAHELKHKYPDDPPFKVVPMDVTLGESMSSIIITGPNTGGKTVALKTIGLLVLMAQAGWPIPAKDTSKVGVFTRLIADIGDEQSIESSLSTFSSHLTRINDALRSADDRSLVLLDELGAGTDPKEGAALGEAIVLELTERRARLIVTTHHTALKTLAQHSPHIENAALQFDPGTLSPTYHFRVGLPGASYAIDIARRLGLPENVTTRAESLVDAQEKDLSKLLVELDERLMSVRNREAELDKSTKAASALEDLFRSRMARIEELEKEKKTEALAEAESIVQNTRREMERLVKEIRESQAERQRVKESHRALADTARRIKDVKREVAPEPEPRPKRQDGPIGVGDRVWIETFKREAEVVSIDNDKEQVKVQLGDFMYTMDRDAVERVESKPTDDSKRVTINVRGGYGGSTSDVGPEVSLRGLSAEDALEVLDRYLDEARLAGWNEVRIVHGRGEGILRRAVGEYLTRDSRVIEKRLGHWNEGGDGVTLARLVPA